MGHFCQPLVSRDPQEKEKLQGFWSSSAPNAILLEYSRAYNIVMLVYFLFFRFMLSTTQETNN